MYETLIAILGGGFAGAGVVKFLSKSLIDARFKQSVKKYQHELDLKKDALNAEISHIINRKNATFNRYTESRAKAIECIYAAIISTSIPRTGLKRYPNITEASCDNDFSAKYFDAFSESFQAFDLVFQDISKAYATLEENVIFISDDLEDSINICLSSILTFYRKRHSILIEHHKLTKTLFDNDNLNKQTMPFDFNVFHDESVNEWVSLTNEMRSDLKKSIRTILAPEV